MLKLLFLLLLNLFHFSVEEALPSAIFISKGHLREFENYPGCGNIRVYEDHHETDKIRHPNIAKYYEPSTKHNLGKANKTATTPLYDISNNTDDLNTSSSLSQNNDSKTISTEPSKSTNKSQGYATEIPLSDTLKLKIEILLMNGSLKNSSIIESNTPDTITDTSVVSPIKINTPYRPVTVNYVKSITSEDMINKVVQRDINTLPDEEIKNQYTLSPNRPPLDSIEITPKSMLLSKLRSTTPTYNLSEAVELKGIAEKLCKIISPYEIENTALPGYGQDRPSTQSISAAVFDDPKINSCATKDSRPNIRPSIPKKVTLHNSHKCEEFMKMINKVSNYRTLKCNNKHL